MLLTVRSSVAVTGSGIPVTDNIRKLILGWANHQLLTSPAGNILQQSFKSRHLMVFNYAIESKTPSVLYPTCTHAGIMIHLIVAGSATYQLRGGETWALQQGYISLLYLPKGSFKILTKAGLSSAYFFELRKPLIRELLYFIPQIKDFLSLVKKKEKSAVRGSTLPINYSIRRYLDQMATTQNSGPALDLELYIYCLQIMLNFRQRELEGSANKWQNTKRLAIVKQIHREILMHPSVKEHKPHLLAKRFFTNERTIRRDFFSVFGINIGQFTTDQVMKYAHILLEDKARSIADIAEELGYNSPSNFSRMFKRYYGTSPIDIKNDMFR